MPTSAARPTNGTKGDGIQAPSFARSCVVPAAQSSGSRRNRAADGRRPHGLAPCGAAAPVVARIFTEFQAGRGLFAIAEGLTGDGIACPSAADPARNRHRCGVAWSKSAIRAILTNPRYVGLQVWNRQRKREVLLDVEDVARGT
jgi:hypothetical protein